jgi:hypothetical protein
MKLSKSAPSKFPPHPPTDGLVRGVIVDITPLEKRQTPFGEKEVFRVVLESEVERAPGDRCLVWSKSFTPSLNEKAGFRKFLHLAFGRDAAETDLDSNGELDVDRLCLGHAVQFSVVHEESDGSTYANICHIMPDRSNTPLQPSGKYVRKSERPAREDDTGPASRTASWQTVTVHVGRCSGSRLGDLERDAVEKLLTNWLPKHQANSSPSPDDLRLASALTEAKSVLERALAATSDF